MVKLRQIAHSRTGDKGDTSNISLIAYEADGLSTLMRSVTSGKSEGAFRRDRARGRRDALRAAATSARSTSCWIGARSAA